jgi:hypothetical protein
VIWLTSVEDDETLLANVPGGALVRIVEPRPVAGHEQWIGVTAALVFVPGAEVERVPCPRFSGQCGRLIAAALVMERDR